MAYDIGGHYSGYEQFLKDYASFDALTTMHYYDGIDVHKGYHKVDWNGIESRVLEAHYRDVDVDLPYDLLRYATQGIRERYNQKGTKMNRKEIIAHQLASLQKELAILDRFGEDVYLDDTVLRFVMKFEGNSTLYSYTALKSVGQWWLSGNPNRTGHVKTWEELTNWWSTRVQSIEIMTPIRDLLNPVVNAQAINAEASQPMTFGDPDGFLFDAQGPSSDDVADYS